MSLEYWSLAKPLFEAARQRPPEQRAAFLAEACSGDDALRAEVERLLALDEASGGFFDALQQTVQRPPSGGMTIPEQVGPWLIVREVGRGGMGRVYEAVRADGLYEQRVALKVVEAMVPGGVERFLRERRILARLEHPHVARLLDGGALPDGRPYLVMEFVEGISVARYAGAERLTVEARLRLFVQICDVVAYAHRNLIVHRDLKPSNILVAVDDEGAPQVKLLDFGIARLLEDDDDSEALTRTGQRLHTPVYAAPEQIRSEILTTATDVYALGLILYELLTGRRPFQPEVRSRQELERAILEDAPTAPSTAVMREARRDADAADRAASDGEGALSEPPDRLRRRLRGDLDRIVLKALRKEPERRYGSVEALGRDLARHLDGLPVEAQPATLRYRLRSFVRRHRTGAAMTGVALACLLLFGSIYLHRVTAERDRAEREAARADRVSTFLTDIFARTDDPETDTGTLLRFLEPAVARADRELASDPDVRAAVLFSLGQLYGRIGLPSRADSLLQRSLALRRELHPDPHEDVAATLFALGEQAIPAPDSALGYFREAAVMRRSLRDGDSHELGWSLLQWDRMLPRDHPEKGERYTEALEMLKRVHGANSPEIAAAIHEYHVLGLAPGTPDETTAAFEEVLSIYRASGLERDPRAIATMYNLGLEYERQGDLERAFPLFRRAVRLGQESLLPGASFLNAMMTNYGASLHEQGRFEEADSMLRAVADVTYRTLPEGASAIAHSHYWHGRNLLSLGRSAEAIRTLRTAVATYRHRGYKGPQYYRVRIELARTLMTGGQYEEAETILTESVDVLSGTRLEPQALQQLIQLYADTDRPTRAAPYRARLDELGG